MFSICIERPTAGATRLTIVVDDADLAKLNATALHSVLAAIRKAAEGAARTDADLN